MDIDEIKTFLRRLNQDKFNIPEILYWICQGLNNEGVAAKTGYSTDTISNRRRTIDEVLQSHGIEGINAHVIQAIEELAGRPPKFDPWPPIEPEPEPEPEPPSEPEQPKEEDDTGIEPISEPIGEPPLPIPNLGPEPLLTRIRNLIPFEITRRNIAVTLIVAAIVFGCSLALTWEPPWIDEEEPVDEPVEIAQVEQDEEVEELMTEVRATQTQSVRETRLSDTLTRTAPTPVTPNPTQTQAAIETEDAQHAFQTATAAVTPTPSSTPTPTETPTPTPTPTATNFQVTTGELGDERVTMTLVEYDFKHQSDEGFIRAIYAVGFTFDFHNHSGEDILLGIDGENISLIDDEGVDYHCGFPIGNSLLSRTLASGATHRFVIGCGRNKTVGAGATTLTLTLKNISSLPDADWIVEIPR
ncbi:MAG: hypothetical protein IPM53_18205 [Anaerolineaceae bacterium]|nr:hypothetical protein [Anaerolineaceae bacterium]